MAMFGMRKNSGWSDGLSTSYVANPQSMSRIVLYCRVVVLSTPSDSCGWNYSGMLHHETFAYVWLQNLSEGLPKLIKTSPPLEKKNIAHATSM